MSESEYKTLLEEVAEAYKKLREAQKEVVFRAHTEYEANQKRLNALRDVTETLYNLLKARGYPNVEAL